MQSKFSNKWIVSSWAAGKEQPLPFFTSKVEWNGLLRRPYRSQGLLSGVLWPSVCHTPNLLLCWDVAFHQRLAFYSSHFDVRCNISELQPQILPTDGHFGPSFTRACHWVDLQKWDKKREDNHTTCVKTSASSHVKEEAYHVSVTT